MQERSSVTELLFVSEEEWLSARWHAGGVEMLDKKPGPMGPGIENLANMFEVTPRTVRPWLTLYGKNTDTASLLPRHRGPRLAHRRFSIAIEQIFAAVIDAWSART